MTSLPVTTLKLHAPPVFQMKPPSPYPTSSGTVTLPGTPTPPRGRDEMGFHTASTSEKLHIYTGEIGQTPHEIDEIGEIARSHTLKPSKTAGTNPENTFHLFHIFHITFHIRETGKTCPKDSITIHYTYFIYNIIVIVIECSSSRNEVLILRFSRVSGCDKR